MAIGKKTFKELIAGLTSESSNSIEILVRNTSSGDVKKISLSNLRGFIISGNIENIGDLSASGIISAKNGVVSLNSDSRNPYIHFVEGGDWYVQVASNGSGLYLGKGFSNSCHVNSDGDFYSPKTINGTAFNNTSDARKKDIIDNIYLSVDQIAEAPSIKFRFKPKEFIDKTGDKSIITDEKEYIGTIAQYWKDILPQAVTEDGDGFYSLQYSNVAMVSVISLAREIIALKKRVEELEKNNI